MKLSLPSLLSVLLLTSIVLSGCSAIFGKSEAQLAHETALQNIPELTDQKTQPSGYIMTGPKNQAPQDNVLPPYLLQVGDNLTIKLLLNPELEEEVIIRPDGKISTAVAQNVMAYGKTPEELQEILNDRYAEYLSNPNVAVIVRSFAPSRIYVLGEVNEPGEYVASGPNFTLLQAIAMAGNIKNSADPDEILVFRRGASDKPQVYRADYDEATSGLSPNADVRLAPYDVVYVPRTTIADAFVVYEQSIQQFIRPALNFGLTYRLDDNGN